MVIDDLILKLAQLLTLTGTGAALVMIIVQLLKTVFHLEGRAASLATLLITAAVFVAHSVAVSTGRLDWFNENADRLRIILENLGYILIPAVGSLAVSKVSYVLYRNNSMPGFTKFPKGT